jgi:hypothetical protein
MRCRAPLPGRPSLDSGDYSLGAVPFSVFHPSFSGRRLIVALSWKSDVARATEQSLGPSLRLACRGGRQSQTCGSAERGLRPAASLLAAGRPRVERFSTT